MIGIVVPGPVRAAAGIPAGPALGLMAVWPMAEGERRGLWVGELTDEDGRRWPITDVLPDDVHAWIAAAKC